MDDTRYFPPGARRQWAENRLLADKWALSEEEENLYRARLRFMLLTEILQAVFGNLVATIGNELSRLPDPEIKSVVGPFTNALLEQHGQFLLDLYQAVTDRLLPAPEPALAGNPEHLSDSVPGGGESTRREP